MKDSRLRLSQVISLFSWLGFSFPLSFPSLPSAPLLRGVTAKFLLLMRHSWAHGPKDIHAGNELENTWPPVSFPQDNLPFPALLGVLPFLFQWPSYQSSRKKKAIVPSCTMISADFFQAFTTHYCKGRHVKWPPWDVWGAHRLWLTFLSRSFPHSSCYWLGKQREH